MATSTANHKSLTVVIPAYNEENNIESTVDSVIQAGEELAMDLEVLVVNDGSADRTREIVRGLLPKYPQLGIRDNDRNMGLGQSLREGFKAAKKDHVTWFPGDHSVTKESIREMWGAIGRADIVIPFMENVGLRSPRRKILSRAYTHMINFLFCLRLKYYNGLLIFPAHVVRSLGLRGEGHDIFCEMLVRAIKKGHSFVEVPFTHRIESDKKSRALTKRNMGNIFRIIFILMVDVYIRRKPEGRSV